MQWDYLSLRVQVRNIHEKGHILAFIDPRVVHMPGQWEDDYETVLDGLGKEGWELVSEMPIKYRGEDASYLREFVARFKRPVEEELDNGEFVSDTFIRPVTSK